MPERLMYIFIMILKKKIILFHSLKLSTAFELWENSSISMQVSTFRSLFVPGDGSLEGQSGYRTVTVYTIQFFQSEQIFVEFDELVQNHPRMNVVQLQPHTSTEYILVQWLRCLIDKQATWGSIPAQVYEFYFVEFIKFDENYGKIQQFNDS